MRNLIDSLRGRWPLADDRVWRGVLALLFVVAVAARVGLWHDLQWHPVSRQHEWPRTLGAHWMRLATSAATGDLALARGGLRVSRPMGEAAPPTWWDRVNEGRLPRGAGAVHLLAVSIRLTGTSALFAVMTILAGGATAVLAACAASRMHGRGAGVLAGLLVAACGNLVVAGIRVGPWAWEALAWAWVLLAVLRVRDGRANPAEWALLGAAVACGAWLRPVFWWGAVLPLPLLLGVGGRARIACMQALLVPLAIGGGGMVARNVSVGAPPVPVAGLPAWDLARQWNPRAVMFPAVPARLEPLEASRASLPRLLSIAMRDREWLEAAPTILRRELRWVLGARDEPDDLSYDYVRRRSPWLRATTLGPDTCAVLGWTGVLALLWRRRLDMVGAASVAVLVAHGVLFTPFGEDRAMLNVAGGILAACGLAEVLGVRRSEPLAPWTWLAAAWLMLAVLWIDDVSRGPRLRYDEFARANFLLAREGRFALADWEMDDYAARERYEMVFDLYEREPARSISPGS